MHFDNNLISIYLVTKIIGNCLKGVGLSGRGPRADEPLAERPGRPPVSVPALKVGREADLGPGPGPAQCQASSRRLRPLPGALRGGV